MIYREMKLQQRKREAFTLMEILIVVAIIVVLAGVGGFYVVRYLQSSNEKTARTQVMVLTKACKAYYLDKQQWPNQLQDLLTEKYIDNPRALIDPWGQQYQYNPQGTNNNGNYPDIFSQRPDKMIGNW